MAERGEENRFAHLLAPIRDLGQNWHTDIAAELSDYLTQLEEITFTFDGGNTNLNFAEGESWRGAGVPGTHSPAATSAHLRSRAAHPGLHLRLLAQGGVPAQAGVQRAGGCGAQAVRAHETCARRLASRAPPAAA